jgi:hypothetical protein
MIDALNILWNEGYYNPDIAYVKDNHNVDSIAAFMALKVNVRNDTNPTVKKAIESVNKEGWIAAMQLEWKSMTGRGVRQGPTLEKRILPNHYPRHPEQQVIRTTWQLLQKLDREGNHVKFKARCCASGDMLRDVIQETFSPTVNALTCVLLQNIALIDRMVQESADVTSAFLYPDYPQDKTPLYLTIEDNVADLLGEPRKCLYRCHKYIYGLPDAGKAFYEMYREHLKCYDYMPTISDPCLFVKHINDYVIYIWIHVDDTYVCGTNKCVVDEFFRILRLKFDITTKQEVDSYIGIKHERLANGDLKLTQPKLLKKLFQTWEVTESSKDSYPSKQYISDKLVREPVDRIMYLTLLGGLIYVLKTRPDIGFAISYAATISTSPDTILHYLYNTQNYGLNLECLEKVADLVMTASVDASYLTYQDSRSQTSFSLEFGASGAYYSRSVK